MTSPISDPLPAAVFGQITASTGQSAALRDIEAHPYVVIADRSVNDLFITVAYASTKKTEANFGAHCVEFSFSADGTPKGLQRTGYYYPGMLFSPPLNGLYGARAVSLDLGLAVVGALSTAIGYGSGTRPASHPRSTRGMLREVSGAEAAVLGTGWVLVLTAHEYSSADRWQLCVPVYNAEPTEEFGPVDVTAPAALRERYHCPETLHVAAGYPNSWRGVGFDKAESHGIQAHLGACVATLAPHDLQRVEEAFLGRFRSPVV